MLHIVQYCYVGLTLFQDYSFKFAVVALVVSDAKLSAAKTIYFFILCPLFFVVKISYCCCYAVNYTNIASYNEIEGKISVKVDSASNGKNSNPKIDEMYLIKNGFKAGKQALKFGISDTNFNTLHSSTEKSQSMSGIGLSFTGETKKINYTLFVGKDTSGADINKDFKEGIIAGNFGDFIVCVSH
jgi:hypothetical protein